MTRSEQMPAYLSRPEKRGAGRTDTNETPLHIRIHGVDTSAAFVERTRQKVSKRLGRFAVRLTRITVRLEDENGPKGGNDMVARIKLVIPSARTIVVHGKAPDAYSAFDRALDAAATALVRFLERSGRSAPKALRTRERGRVAETFDGQVLHA